MKCPKCGSPKTRKVGKIPTVNKGKRQRYQCKECGKSFYQEDAK